MRAKFNMFFVLDQILVDLISFSFYKSPTFQALRGARGKGSLDAEGGWADGRGAPGSRSTSARFCFG